MNENKEFERWMPLAESVANDIVKGDDNEDAKQEAYIGLVYAIRTFKPEMGWKFSTYAKSCVRNSVLDMMRREIRQTKEVETSDLLDERPQVAQRPADDSIIYNETVDKIVDACGDMTPREQDVLYSYLLSEDPTPVRDLAEEWGVSHTTIVRDVVELKRRIEGDYKWLRD